MSVNDERPLLLPGPAGDIEARLLLPPAGADCVAVVCHPHPLHGGSMDNKVVTTLVRAWRDAGLATLRFNFRGVGASTGLHADGVGEVDDLLALLCWLQEEQKTARVLLAGFSFGAWVAAAASLRLPPGLALERLVLVAPPVHYPGFADLEPPVGTLVAQGGGDEVVDAQAVVAWVGSRRQPPELICLDKAGHFFHGRLTELKAELAARMFPGQ